MDAQSLAIVLLGIRIVAVALLGATIYKQVKQIRTTTTDYPGVRLAVLLATIVLFAGQFVPILLDAVVAFGSTYGSRSVLPESLHISYSISNALKDVIIGGLLAVQHYRPRNKRV